MKRQATTDETIERFDTPIDVGLTSEQVEKRIKQKLFNKTTKQTTKTYFEIIKSNVLTFFNILLTIIAIAEIAVGNAEGIIAFMTVMILNMIIGLFQDIRAKRLVEKLKLSVEPTVKVIRDGKIQDIPTGEIVLDDIFFLETGKQISVDAIVIDGELEVDESIITGESLSIKKAVGDLAYSGSYVISGKATLRAEKVGKNSLVEEIQSKAKQFKRPKSELLKSLNKIFHIISLVIIPLGIMLFFKDFFNSQALETSEKIKEAVKSTSASMIGMIPAGMFLFTSMTLAVGVLRLGKKKTMVQELYSIEMLARSNVLCFDKTGTLTDGTMSINDIEVVGNTDVNKIKEILGSMLNATQDKNQTAKAIIKDCPLNDIYTATNIVPFSSVRKYSMVTFKNKGTYVLGAAEFIIKKLPKSAQEKIEELSKKGLRVVVLAHSLLPSKKDVLPLGCKIVAFISIKDNIRENAYDTISWFKKNDVDIKIISGDNPITVSEIARQCGVDNYDSIINLDGLSDDEVKASALKYTIFGRVSPEQKALLVESLKEANKTVAMTGDGVNDIIALKKADCSIAMASGADATKYSSHLVLMDSDFSHMPEIVQEGRRVVNNLQQTCSLFLNKTIFAFLLSVILLIVAVIGMIFKSAATFQYPFETQHLYIWEFCGIGIASFFLSLQPNDKVIQGGFVNNVVCNAIPGGVTITLAVLTLLLLNLNGAVGSEHVIQTMGMFIISFMCLVVLFRCCWPFNKYRTILFSSLTVLTVTLFVVLSIVSEKKLIVIGGKALNIFKIYPSELTTTNILTTIGIIVVFTIIYFVIYYLFDRFIRGKERGVLND